MKKDWTDDFVYHWKYYLVPARASPSDLEFIKQKILEKINKLGKNISILVLGSTPEYRNLCSELGIPVTLLDYNRKNYEYLATEVKNKPKEIFIEGNWLTALPKEKFDIILGDNAINIIKKKDLPLLCANISQMLKKDGFFMPRTYIRDKDERWTGEEAISQYRKEANGKSLYTWAGRNFYLAAYNFKIDKVVLKDVWDLIKKLHNKGLISDKEIGEYSRLSYEGRELEFFIPVKEELDKIFLKFFNIKEIFNGTEPYLKNKFPLHVLAKK